MPRTARVVIPEMSLHVVQRGHDQQDCFFNESDYLAYLDYLREFAERFGCSVHAYCLMTNHVHLLMTPRTANACSQVMKFTGQYYVNRINRRLGRSGTLWEGRFYSCIVPSERYALTCYRYIELNPVDAGMVSRPADYRWSSYAANVSPGSDDFLTVHPAYETLGIDALTRATAYTALFDLPLEPKLVDDIRKATRGGYVAGAPRKRGRPPLSEKSEKQGLSLFTENRDCP
jgi:putative transposase